MRQSKKQKCRTCYSVKPLSEFSFRNDNKKFRTNCKPCRSNYSAVQRYGITLGDVEVLKEAQDNSCAICGTHAEDIEHASFKHNPLVIDHDHKTGKVRGLLCSKCNNGIGLFNDKPVLFKKAIKYLEESEK